MSSENPKSSKPIMEKRRRARINNSLNELKTILLGALKKDTTRHSKLEKADILEMTVKYLRKLERQRVTAMRMDPAVLNKYKAGFNECRNEVMKFLSTHEGVAVEVRTRLLGHLAVCQQNLQEQSESSADDYAGDEAASWKPSLRLMEFASSSLQHPSSQPSGQGKEPAPEKQARSETADAVPMPLILEGQFQIIPSSTALSSSSSGVANPFANPLKDVTLVVPAIHAPGAMISGASPNECGYPQQFLVHPVAAAKSTPTFQRQFKEPTSDHSFQSKVHPHGVAEEYEEQSPQFHDSGATGHSGSYEVSPDKGPDSYQYQEKAYRVRQPCPESMTYSDMEKEPPDIESYQSQRFTALYDSEQPAGISEREFIATTNTQPSLPTANTGDKFCAVSQQNWRGNTSRRSTSPPNNPWRPWSLESL